MPRVEKMTTTLKHALHMLVLVAEIRMGQQKCINLIVANISGIQGVLYFILYIKFITKLFLLTHALPHQHMFGVMLYRINACLIII